MNVAQNYTYLGKAAQRRIMVLKGEDDQSGEETMAAWPVQPSGFGEVGVERGAL